MITPFPLTRGVNYICKVLKLNKAIRAKYLVPENVSIPICFPRAAVNLSVVLEMDDKDIFFGENQDGLIGSDRLVGQSGESNRIIGG